MQGTLRFDPDKFETVTTKKDMLRWERKCRASRLFCFDSETTGLDVFVCDLVGLSFATVNDDGLIEACYIPVGHTGKGKQAKLKDFIDIFGPILADPEEPKVLHNALYDLLVLMQERYAMTMHNVHDTMLMSYALTSTPEPNAQHGMDYLAAKYLGHRTIRYDDVVIPALGHVTFADVGIPEATQYSSEDTAVTLMLALVFEALLRDDGQLWEVYDKIDRPLLKVQASMKQAGVKVDVELCDRLTAEWKKRCEALVGQAHKQAKQKFKIGSSTDLSRILFDEMKLPVANYTDGGKASVAKNGLDHLKSKPLVATILEWRGLDKLVSTYTTSLPKKVRTDTGRVHPNFPIVRTATGRLASNDPNLQNIPTRTKEGKQLREAFIAEQGFSIVGGDYSQIELRVAAHLSEDPTLMMAYLNDVDVHQMTASKIRKIKLADVTKAQRSVAKTANFLALYGGGYRTLGVQAEISEGEAFEFLNEYWEALPRLRDYIAEVKDEARRNGYASTMFGRKVPLRFIHSKNREWRGHAERLAFSVRVQGSAADLMRMAMPAVADEFSKCRGVLFGTVHDELIGECPTDKAEYLAACAQLAMDTAADHLVKWRVPIKSEWGVGKTWGEAKP